MLKLGDRDRKSEREKNKTRERVREREREKLSCYGLMYLPINLVFQVTKNNSFCSLSPMANQTGMWAIPVHKWLCLFIVLISVSLDLCSTSSVS